MWDEIKSTIEKTFSFSLNINQWREIKRLLHEISIRDKDSPEKIIERLSANSKIKNARGRDTFFALKRILLKFRFPLTDKVCAIDTNAVFLPELKLSQGHNYRPTQKFNPLEIFIEKQLFLYHKLKVDNKGIFQITGLPVENPEVYKAKKFACKSLKGRGVQSGIRVIYAYDEEKDKIVLIEMYFKGDKANEDKQRIFEYLR